jgi:hypothetical protein
LCISWQIEKKLCWFCCFEDLVLPFIGAFRIKNHRRRGRPLFSPALW